MCWVNILLFAYPKALRPQPSSWKEFLHHCKVFLPKKVEGELDRIAITPIQQGFDSISFVVGKQIVSDPFQRVIIGREHIMEMNPYPWFQGRKDHPQRIHDIALEFNDVAGVDEQNIAGFQAGK